MRLLRLWGGYPFDEWLDACDEAGVLSVVDMMYANVQAKATAEQEQELRDNLWADGAPSIDRSVDRVQRVRKRRRRETRNPARAERLCDGPGRV